MITICITFTILCLAVIATCIYTAFQRINAEKEMEYRRRLNERLDEMLDDWK